MIAVDSSVLIPWLNGEDQPRFDQFAAESLCVAPSTVTEVMSGPGLTDEIRRAVLSLRRIALQDGYWERAGLLRRLLIGKGRKAALGDVLVAQACLDADLPLLTGDRDFKAFAEFAGLQLIQP